MKNDAFDFIFGTGRFKKPRIILYFLLHHDYSLTVYGFSVYLETCMVPAPTFNFFKGLV